MRSTVLASILALPLAAACDSTPTGDDGPSQQSSILGISGDSAELNVVADEMEGGVNQDPFVQDPMMPQ